jgi:hypothetical protein
MSYAELITANTLIIVALYVLERIWFLKQEAKKKIVYENLEYIKPENYDHLKNDLENRTGLTINKISVENIDFLNGTASIFIYYLKENKSVYKPI